MPPQEFNPAEIGQPASHPHSERRRRVRHKLHLPAYVGLGSNLNSTSDVSEIVDLSEDGMAIQTASVLEVGGQQALFLDLLETGGSVQTSGTVIWSDASGRAGIRFLDLPAESLHCVKKWLFADALAGCVQPAGIGDADEPASRHENERDHTTVLIALAAVRKEVESLGADLDAALHLIARRAQVFTSSTAAAVGLTDGTDMICRATAGLNAPPVGVRLRVGSGFSGECVRTGRLLRCEDAETDPRVDRESCRALGIRSILAAPIRSQGGVVGLIEVFAAQANVFRTDHELVLQRLTEVVSAAVLRASLPESVPAVSVDDEFPVETPADLPILRRSRLLNLLLASFAMTVFFVVLWAAQRGGANGGDTIGTVSSQAVTPSPPANQFGQLQKLAAGGDSAAQFDIGVRYWTGDQVAQDYGQAVRWFSLAAEGGNIAAQSMLGNCYEAGRGVPADPARAYYWSLLAEAGGDGSSKTRTGLLASHLNAGQIAVARKEANDWLAQHPRVAKDMPSSQ